jgi:hypothetical protein
MRKIGITLCALLFLAFSVQAQVKTPAPSPMSKVSQMVGLTEIEVEYSRPGMKGRTIFGADGLVPYGQMWRTGANASTKITFSDDVTIMGNELAAGTYALYTIPNKDEWAVIFYKDLSLWGVPREYKQEDEALKVMVKPQTINHEVETFLINIGEVGNSKAHLELIWDNTLVAIPVMVATDEMVESSIKKTLNGPSHSDYYRAARYYYDEEKDMLQAHAWIIKANEIQPAYWQLYLQAEIAKELKQYENAIAAAEKSIELAKKEGADSYVKNNEKLIAEIKGMMGDAPKKLNKSSKM